MAIKNMLGKVMKLVKDHDTTILTGLTIAGTIVAVVTAWNARPKCERILDELNAKGATNGEKAKALAPVVAPTVIATAVSVGCALAHEKTTGDRISGLINTASTLATASDIRKAAEQNVVGPEKAEEIDKAVAKEVVESTPATEIKKTNHGDKIFYERNTGSKFRASKDFVELGFAHANAKLARCYNSYGMCTNDEYELPLSDIFREWGVDGGQFAEMFVIRAKDHSKVTYNLINTEFTLDDGTEEQGYIIDIVTPLSLDTYKDRY
jgi:hypothetical protein